MRTINDILILRRNRHRLESLARVGSIVPYVGAGMSSGIYPMWREFLEQFDLLPKEHTILKQYLDNGQFEDAASYLSTISNRGFIDTVKCAFSPSLMEGSTFSPSLKYLPRISENMVITTNLDEVLENVWINEGEPFDAIITPDCEDQFNEAIIGNGKTLVKMHGTVKESSKYVLTKEQYDKYYGIDSNDTIDFDRTFPRDLSRALYSKTLLFMGCSLRNDRILHVLKQIAGRNEYIYHYAIMPLEDDDESTTLRERDLENFGIYPIWFPKDDYSCITYILEELLAKKKATTT